MANLKKRGDYWSVQWWWDGKPRIKALKTRDAKKAERVRLKLEAILKKLQTGLFPKASRLLQQGYDIVDVIFPNAQTAHLIDHDAVVDDGNPLTLGELTEQYYEHLRKNHSDRHYRSVRARISHLVEHLGTDERVTGLDRKAIDNLIDRRKDEDAKPTTIENELRSIKAMLNWAVQTGRAGNNPVKAWPAVKTSATDPFLTKADIERIIRDGKLTEEQIAELGPRMVLEPKDIDTLVGLARKKAPGLVLPLMLVSTTGIRRGELVSLLKQDFDPRAERLSVRSRKGSRRQVATTRVIDVHPDVLSSLREHYRSLKDGSLLFPVFEVPKVEQRVGERPIEDRRADRAGRLLEDLIAGTEFQLLGGWHALRHSFISICVWNGLTFEQISKWSGHIDPETQRRYTHFMGDRSKALMGDLPFKFRRPKNGGDDERTGQGQPG